MKKSFKNFGRPEMRSRPHLESDDDDEFGFGTGTQRNTPKASHV